jgi:hypothetical protein
MRTANVTDQPAKQAWQQKTGIYFCAMGKNEFTKQLQLNDIMGK